MTTILAGKKTTIQTCGGLDDRRRLLEEILKDNGNCFRQDFKTASAQQLVQKNAAAATAATSAATATADIMENTNMLVKSRGIDVRPKLVHEISGIAELLGGDFEHLSFTQETIQDFSKTASTPTE
jgi:hypothetical protein